MDSANPNHQRRSWRCSLGSVRGERGDSPHPPRAAATQPTAYRRSPQGDRLLGIGPNPSTKNAELIAFRVGEYHPRRVTLPDIGPPSTGRFDFCGLIDRTEVRMESVLACLLLRNRHKQQARHPIRSRPNLELVRGVAHDNPAQGLGPPSTKRDRIMSVKTTCSQMRSTSRTLPGRARRRTLLRTSSGIRFAWSPPTNSMTRARHAINGIGKSDRSQ